MKFSGIFFLIILASEIQGQRDRKEWFFLIFQNSKFNWLKSSKKDTTPKKKTEEETAKKPRGQNEEIEDFDNQMVQHISTKNRTSYERNESDWIGTKTSI